MTLSEIVAAELLSSEGITENTKVFNSGLREFSKDMELINKEGDVKVYKRHADDLFVEDYDTDREAEDAPNKYKLWDVVWKDDKLQYVSNTTGLALCEPWEYAEVDEGIDQSNWEQRYAKIAHFNNSSGCSATKTDDYIASGDFAVTAIFYELVGDNDVLDIYQGYTTGESIELGHCEDDNGDYLYMTTAGDIVWGNTDDDDEDSIRAEAFGDDFYITDQVLDIDKEDGYEYIYKLGDVIDSDSDAHKFNLYKADKPLRQRAPKLITTGGEDEVATFDKLHNVGDGAENGVDEQNEYRQYLINTAFINVIADDNIDVYVRTRNNKPTEYKEVDSFVYAELTSVDEISWGWTYYRPTAQYAPFDGKNYTYLEEDNEVIYEIQANDIFDVIAINGLVASLVKVEIYDTDNETILETKEYVPNCTSNLSGKTKRRKDTSIIYLDREYPKDTKIKVTFEPKDGYLRVGGGYFGNKNVVGFTNLEFTNEIIDYNYYEQDKFGNIIYTGDKNAKVRKFIGTADIRVKDYDDVEPVLRGMLSDKIIVDGSDNWENKTTDSQNYFNSSMIIGRLRRASQKTKLTNEKLDNLATYSFTIEEDI